MICAHLYKLLLPQIQHFSNVAAFKVPKMFANKDMFGDRSSSGRVSLKENGFKQAETREPQLSQDRHGNIDTHDQDGLYLHAFICAAQTT